MRRIALVLALTLAVGAIAGGVIETRVLNAQQAPIQLRALPLKHTQLYKVDLAGMEGKQGVVIAVEYAPGASDEKHYHPGQLFTYVLEGSVVWEVEGQPPVTLKAGDTFYDPPKRVHNHRNASTSAPAKFLVFFVEEKGQPRSVPVK